MSLDSTIRAVQEKLGVAVDGNPGPETWSAIHLSVMGAKPAANASLDSMIRAVQQKLGLTVDGNAGPETWDGISLAVLGKTGDGGGGTGNTQPLTSEGKIADSRSEGNIATLHPRVRPYARALVEKAAGQGILIKVTSGTRTYAKQDELFTEGRDDNGKIINKKEVVTDVRGGYSNHNFGIAFDVTIFKGSPDPEKAKTPVYDSPVYKAIGSLGTGLGLTWGGSWTTFVDEPHFELRPAWAAQLSESAMLTELRKRAKAGIDPYA